VRQCADRVVCCSTYLFSKRLTLLSHLITVPLRFWSALRPFLSHAGTQYGTWNISCETSTPRELPGRLGSQGDGHSSQTAAHRSAAPLPFKFFPISQLQSFKKARQLTTSHHTLGDLTRFKCVFGLMSDARTR
jgi:hypothetical protein